MMKNFITLIVLTFICASIQAQKAQIYFYKDANGNITYTSDPPSKTKVTSVQLGQIQLITAPSKKERKSIIIPKEQPQKSLVMNSRLYLDGLPEEGTSLRANNGTFTVTIKSEPDAFIPTHQFRLVVDGSIYAPEQQSPVFTITSMSRGLHTFRGEVLENGIPIAVTEVRTFTLQRVHTKRPAFQGQITQPQL